jgi:hypothetical protein
VHVAHHAAIADLERAAEDFTALLVSLNSSWSNVQIPDEGTREARQILFEEFIGRATETIESQDTQAAKTWIEEIDTLDVDALRVSETDASLTARLLEMESLKSMPTSSLEAIEFVAASYPLSGRQRNRRLGGYRVRHHARRNNARRCDNRGVS